MGFRGDAGDKNNMSSRKELSFLINHLPESLLFYFILNCHLEINKDICTQRKHKLGHKNVEARAMPLFYEQKHMDTPPQVPLVPIKVYVDATSDNDY